MAAIIDNEMTLRLCAFMAIFAVMGTWEALQPYRQARFSRRQRWPHQLGLIAVNALLLRLLFPSALTGIALTLEQQQIGLFNAFETPLWLSLPLAIILLDLIIYWQHVLAHRWEWFWRLHRTHHADTDYDLTTGLRFHPLEIILSMLIKITAVTILGAPAVAVVLFEIILFGSAMFNHANVQLPQNLEWKLRRLLVTPAMHRIHHSIHRDEHDNNYGFFLALWDHGFGSYLATTRESDQHMPIGLKRFREADAIRLDQILGIPWRQDTHGQK